MGELNLGGKVYLSFQNTHAHGVIWRSSNAREKAIQMIVGWKSMLFPEKADPKFLVQSSIGPTKKYTTGVAGLLRWSLQLARMYLR